MAMLLKLLQCFTILILILSRTKAASQVAQALPGCPDKCGNVTIPYPFGIQKGCYLSEAYQVNCTTLKVSNTSFKLLDISLDDGLMHGLLPMAHHCYNSTGHLNQSQPNIRLSRFQISSTINLLTTVGCSTRADLMDSDGKHDITGCISKTNCTSLTDGSCTGKGCMQVPLPSRLSEFRIHARRVTSRVGNWSFNNCTYGFLVQKSHYIFQKTDLDNMQNRSFPVALEWTVGNTSCEDAKINKSNYICKENSVCVDPHCSSSINKSHAGYNSRCAPGYKGNPYLPNGCQDINECEEPLNDCTYGCVNTNGSYTCYCPIGMRGDGRENGSGCFHSEAPKSLRNSLYIAIGTSAQALQLRLH
ncbi:hypothetical protein L1987_87928 [Smallanthus sonchifolius]|nr:hypothetical protein L1987_87928 [Smallanthus sonchifolius]